MQRRDFLVGASTGIAVSLSGCLFGDGGGPAGREELSEYVTFEHTFESATTGMDLRISFENQTDRSIAALAVPDIYVDEEEITTDSRSANLEPGGTGEVVIPILIDEDEQDDVTRYVLAITVFDGPETLVEYEEEFEDFQSRVES